MSTISTIQKRQDRQGLMSALHALAQGDHTVRLPLTGDPEERQLARDFNAVAERSQTHQPPAMGGAGDAERRTELFAEQLLAQSQFLVQELKRQQTELTRLTEHIVQQLADGPLPMLRARNRQQRLPITLGATSPFSPPQEPQAELFPLAAGEAAILTLTPPGNPGCGTELLGHCQATPVPVGDGRSALHLARHLAPAAILLPGPLPDLELSSFLALLCRSSHTRHIPVFVAPNGSAPGPCLQLNGWMATAFGRTARLIGHLPHPPRRLLVADADETRRGRLCSRLRACVDVHETIPVGSGSEAHALLAQGAADGLAMGPDLNDMDAFDLMQRLLEQPPAHDFPFMLFAAPDSVRLGCVSAVCDAETRQERLMSFVRRSVSPAGTARSRDSRTDSDGRQASVRKVVVVDDDLDSVYPIVDALERQGIAPLVADCGKEGLETLLAHSDAGLVLMDVTTPHVEGPDTIHIIRGLDEFRHLPIIAMASGSDPGEYVRLINAGASDYLTKPVNGAQLDALLRVWLA